MEPFKSTERHELAARGSLEERLAFANHIGNHKPDSFRFKQAIIRTARQHLKSKGVSEERLKQLIPPKFALPPASRGMPTTGSVKIFALLIEFADYQHKNAANTIQSMLFGNPTTGKPYESLTNYYKRASYNKLVLGGTTLGWYKTSKKRSEITLDDNGQEITDPAVLDSRRDSLIKEALLHFKAQGHNFTQYDNNNDGVIDYFLVFWTGPDTGWGSFWWGYKPPGFSDSNFKLDGKSLKNYTWQWESNPVGTAFSPRTAIHETGHALGLPDLYDYKPGIGPDGGVGDADIMDGGWLDHNCFSKWMLDWLEPNIIGSGVHTLPLNPSGNSQDCVAIWPYLDEGEIFSELFIVQNRQPVENDSELPGKGLMIWHIDARLNSPGTDFGFNNSDTPHKLVRLMEADGLEDIEANRRFNVGDLYTSGKTFGSNTTPSSVRYDGRSSFVEVSNITASGSQLSAVFKIRALLYNAVWGWARKDFDKHQAELQAQGYSLAEINAFVHPGATDASWNGIWGDIGEDSVAVWSWARKDFDKHQAELQAQGYRLIKINAYVRPGATDASWNGIWVKTNEDRRAVWGWARKDFDKHQAELEAQGYKLIEINAFVHPGATDASWNGIWVKTNEDRRAVWGWAREDFDKHQAELQAQGYRLTKINAFVHPSATDASWNGIWVKP